MTRPDKALECLVMKEPRPSPPDELEVLVSVGTITAILRTSLNGPPGEPSPLVSLTIPLGDMLCLGSSWLGVDSCI